MPKKMTAIESKFAEVLTRFEVSSSPELLAALVQAAKPERKAPAVKRDDSEVREVVAEFCKASGVKEPPNLWTKPSKEDIFLWIVPAKKVIYQCNGKSKIAIVEGVKALREGRLTCATPKSAQKMAIDWHAKQVGDAVPTQPLHAQPLQYKL